MKLLSSFAIALLIAGIACLTGCYKPPEAPLDRATEPHQHFLSGEFNGWCSFVPAVDAGWVPSNPAPAWHAGETSGSLNLLAQSRGFFSMYVTLGREGLQGAPASLDLFFADELNELAMKPPNEVSIMFYDKQGNCVWAREIGDVPVNLETPTCVAFSGEAEILGGTGQFANATGRFHLLGHFDPQNPRGVKMEIPEGVIVY